MNYLKRASKGKTEMNMFFKKKVLFFTFFLSLTLIAPF